MGTYVLACGVAAYPAINPLPVEVINDATAVGAFFGDDSKVKDASTAVLLDSQATATNILNAIADIAKAARRESTVVIYFSGHGAQVVSGPNQGAYLLPYDVSGSSDKDIASTGISSQAFTEALRRIDARRLLVIFDCCHSAGIGQAKSADGAEVKSGLSLASYEALSTGRGRVIFSSSRENEVSMVYPGRDQNSLFTKHLLDGLNGSALCVDGTIRVFDLFQYVTTQVRAENPNQNPVFKAELEDNFPIALAVANVASITSTATTEDVSKQPEDGFEFDVFISYTHNPDKQWVRKTLYKSLKAAGLKVCLDDYSFRLGHPILDEMERAVEVSRYTIGVFSPEYLESEFAGLENTMAKHLGLEKKQKRFIGLIHRECTPKLSDRIALMLDMTDEEEYERNIERLVYSIKERII